jgi:flagellar biosynthetic protein FliQ
MDADGALRLLSETLYTALQVVTQIQEMTLTFVPKLVALLVTFILLGGWMLATVVEFTKRLINSAAGL